MGLALVAGPALLRAGAMSSANYDNDWNCVDSGGNTRSSANYLLFDAQCQAAEGDSVFGSYDHYAGFI